MIKVAIIGLGYWGPNLLRNFNNLKGCRVAACCDIDDNRLKEIGDLYPDIDLTCQAVDIFRRIDIDAVVIATQTSTHYGLARQSLESGFHTFVEKPLATSTKECEELIQLAKRNNVKLFVGHTFLYTAAVRKMKELIDLGDLGSIYHIHSRRLNLGPVRQDVNVLWDLAAHDVSVILSLLGKKPVSVNCQGLAYLDRDIHDVAILTINFEDCMATIHVSWLDPNKVRQMTIVGDRKMICYDDIEQKKLRIYNKKINRPLYANDFGEFQYSYHYGDTYCPRLAEEEPLKTECRHFIDCIQNGKSPITDGRNGLEVVRILEVANRSLLNDGGNVRLGT